MKLYSSTNNKLKPISSVEFKLEKDIQNLVENNLNELFKLELVRSEFTIKNFRIDTLGFDKENKSFVIIEYKKSKNYSVIDQGYTYMSLMLNNKSDFILEYIEKCDAPIRKNEIDWSQSRVIFVSPQFTDYQLHSVNFKDVPFELWEIKEYENNLIGFIQLKTDSEESVTTISNDKDNVVSKVSKQVKVYTEKWLLENKNRPDWVKELYFELKEKILEFGDVQMKPTGKYMSFRRNSPFVDIVFYNKGLYTIINMKEGTLKDPNNLTKTFDGKGHWGNGDYYLTITQSTDLYEVMRLIKQSYKSQE